MAFISDDITSALVAAIHTMRMELGFGLMLGLLWMTGRMSGARFANAKTNNNGQISQGKRRTMGGSGNQNSSSRSRTGAPQREGSRSIDAAGNHELDARVENCVRNGNGFGSLDKALLTDHAWVAPQIVALARNQVHKGLELYRVALAAGLDLHQVSTAENQKLFMALLTAVIRVGEAREALALLQDLRKKGLGIPLALFYSATKLCTAKQLYSDCLAIYKFVSQDPSLCIDDRSVWSCLLFSAVETKAYEQCVFLWEQLRKAGTPSNKDYGNIVRYSSIKGNWHLALSLVRDMRDTDIEVDSVIYNTVLATCVSAEKTEEACSLLDDMEQLGVTDVITYNTLAKGYARIGKIEQCFSLYERMRGRGVAPSQVTYGILLDVCINENQVDRAAEVADSMDRDGCEMNTVLCTTLIKGFARAGQLERAMKVYEQMRSGRGQPPDLITFSILIKANCDSHRLDVAFKLLEAMFEFGLRPDEVVFNNLLGGCCKESNADLGKRLYSDMISAGIRPSSATFSILIRLYSQCKLLEDAVEMLKTEPKARHVEPEPRLFSQLLQCCLRERQGRRAVEVYNLMLEHTTPTAATHSSVLSMCVKLNMLDTGSEILTLAAASARGRVDAQDAMQFLEAAQRKRKSQVVDACVAAMDKLGISR